VHEDMAHFRCRGVYVQFYTLILFMLFFYSFFIEKKMKKKKKMKNFEKKIEKQKEKLTIYVRTQPHYLHHFRLCASVK